MLEDCPVTARSLQVESILSNFCDPGVAQNEVFPRKYLILSSLQEMMKNFSYVFSAEVAQNEVFPRKYLILSNFQNPGVAQNRF